MIRQATVSEILRWTDTRQHLSQLPGVQDGPRVENGVELQARLLSLVEDRFDSLKRFQLRNMLLIITRIAIESRDADSTIHLLMRALGHPRREVRQTAVGCLLGLVDFALIEFRNVAPELSEAVAIGVDNDMEERWLSYQE